VDNVGPPVAGTAGNRVPRAGTRPQSHERDMASETASPILARKVGWRASYFDDVVGESVGQIFLLIIARFNKIN
jgi:hypothetical protein